MAGIQSKAANADLTLQSPHAFEIGHLAGSIVACMGQSRGQTPTQALMWIRRAQKQLRPLRLVLKAEVKRLREVQREKQQQ